jgi:nucleoid-associated protein YgaU
MSEPKRLLKIFLCHASQDKPSVRELAQCLFAEGWIDPWLDEKKLLPGQDWRLKIEEAVETSDIVIICLSSNSVSKEGAVQKELRYAKEIALEKLEESIFLIPLRIDECAVPRGLRFYQWADYFGEKKDETYNALLESLRLRYEQKLKIEKEEHARKEKERLEHEAAEKVAREKAERKAAEIAAREKAEREAAEKVAQEKAEREAAERIARENAKRKAAEIAKREKAERQAAQKASTAKAIFESFSSLKSVLAQTRPFFRVVGVIGIIIVLFWGGSLVMPHLLSLIPTAKPSATITPTNIPTQTLTPLPVEKIIGYTEVIVQQSPTETPVPTLAIPTGKPVTLWHAFPIMKNATSGQVIDEKTYRFAINSTIKDVSEYYQSKVDGYEWIVLPDSISIVGNDLTIDFVKNHSLLKLMLLTATQAGDTTIITLTENSPY